VTYFKELSQNLPERKDRNYKTLSTSCVMGTQSRIFGLQAAIQEISKYTER
jgi:hypothetical protein